MAIAPADRFDPHGLKKTRMQLASAGARIARRTTSWDSPGFVFNFALVAAACVVLYRLLDDVDVLKTAAALRAIPMRAIITAFLLIAASYFTLTFSVRRAEIDPVRHLPMRSGADSGSPEPPWSASSISRQPSRRSSPSLVFTMSYTP